MSISEELVERMVAYFRAVASHPKHLVPGDRAEALEIAALLVESVDPDLIEARQIAANTLGVGDDSFAAGFHDRSQLVVSTLAGIKRGRELERQS